MRGLRATLPGVLKKVCSGLEAAAQPLVSSLESEPKPHDLAPLSSKDVESERTLDFLIRPHFRPRRGRKTKTWQGQHGPGDTGPAPCVRRGPLGAELAATAEGGPRPVSDTQAGPRKP